jgi:hypothetical protein
MLSITRGTRRGKGRPSSDAVGARRGARTWLAVSLAVNAGLMLAFFHALTLGYRWDGLFERKSGEVPAERISFFRLPAGPAALPGRSGGDGRPVGGQRTAATRPRFVPPTGAPAAPTTAPAPVAGGAGERPGPAGSGAVVGEGGAEEGIRPTYADPRLWTRPGTLAAAPKSAKERIDSVIADGLRPARDSILAARELAAGQRKPGDWTFKGKGGTWGMDQRSLHLGKIAVPNALLALLSTSFQQNLRGNPTEMVNERRLAEVRRDLMDHAQREIAEDDFRGAVRAIRARKDRERNERLAERRRNAEGAGTVADAPTGGPGAQPQ